MSAPTGVRCGGCYYFHPTDANSERPGECHRSPPPGSRDWPTVLADDWCGEFRHQSDWPDALGAKPVPVRRPA